jgi:glucosamine-6-phosphate deaminase
MGLADLSEARNVLLLARGGHKAEVIHAALREPPTPNVPASVLQYHPQLIVLLDAAAAGRVTSVS